MLLPQCRLLESRVKEDHLQFWKYFELTSGSGLSKIKGDPNHLIYNSGLHDPLTSPRHLRDA